MAHQERDHGLGMDFVRMLTTSAPRTRASGPEDGISGTG